MSIDLLTQGLLDGLPISILTQGLITLTNDDDLIFLFPVFPVTPGWDNKHETTSALNRTQYNEGGTIKREPIGLNTLTRKLAISVATIQIEQADLFFANNLGKACKLSYDGGLFFEPDLYRINQYTLKYYSDTVRGVDCELEQVRRFKQ